MSDMQTNQTPEALAEEIKRLALSMRNAALAGKELTASALEEAIGDAVDELASAAALAGQQKAPHRWLFIDEHGQEGITSLSPSQWNARSKNTRTGVTPLHTAIAATKRGAA